MGKYQTLSQFMADPFNRGAHTKDTEYDVKYRIFVRDNKIRLYAYMQVEEAHYVHIKVPSESGKSGSIMYDVVIRFFTDSNEIKKESHLRNYYIQFYSNSPSFMYQYAYVYNQEGFLIESLYDKLDPDYINTPPTKRNADLNLSYDKSIYFACKYLLANQFKYLNKHGPIELKKKNMSIFLRGISDFRSMKFDQALLQVEKQLAKELDGKYEKIADRNARKKRATSSTDIERPGSPKGHSINTIKASGRIAKKAKIRAVKSTIRKK